MIVALVFIIAVSILIAFFIGKNLDYNCPIWFLKTFESTNVAAIVFFAFAAGIVFTLLCLFLAKLIKATWERETLDAIAEEEKKERKALRKQKKEKKNKKRDKKSVSVEQNDEKKSDDLIRE